MNETARVTLVFDPFSVAKEEGDYVSGLKDELSAFAEINDSLRRDATLETVLPKTYVIAASSIEHFRTYREVKGVDIRTITPRSLVGDQLHSVLPDWLTNEDICQWRLLEYSAPESIFDDSWEATIASWLVPGIEKAATLEQWLRIVSSAIDRFTKSYGSGPVSVWIQEQFFDLAKATVELSSHEFASSLKSELTRALSPVAFAKQWIRRKALLPLMSVSIDAPLRLVGVENVSVRDRQLTNRLPLTFPLPSPIHEEVSQLFCKSLQKERIREKLRMSDAVKSLNAVWYGVAEEIRTWLDVYPKGLSKGAADHLCGLPGFESNELIRKIVDQFRPPETVSAWPGLSEHLEPWVTNYAKYIRSCFLRRDLNEQDDPAIGFARWLKDHFTVCFDHHEYSYFRVAQSVQKALSDDRTVFLVMVDALPIHQSVDMIGYLSDSLGEHPTTNSYMFVPLPTITEVCKEAILTGKIPSECRGDLSSQLQKRYKLSEDEVHVSANWQDAELFQGNANTRLVVYRDNRLDDQLHKLMSYSAMLEDSKGVFLQISRLLKRWADDVRCITQKSPLIIVTADHGFTFGQSPGNETVGHRVLDGVHRCVVLDGPISAADAKDESLTVIDKEVFRLKSSYLAAKGRYFGRGTVSGWSMSHGGLLPEEVIVPFVQWFGHQEVSPWPAVSFADGAYVDRGRLHFTINLKNTKNLASLAGTLRVGITGEDEKSTKSIGSIASGKSLAFEMNLEIGNMVNRDTVPISVTILARDRKSGEMIEYADDFLVPRKKLLVEKTSGQDDFEKMF